MPLAAAEGDVQTKAEESQLGSKWKDVNVQAIHDRGLETIHSIYDPHFLPKIFATWGAHRADVQFNVLFTVYGLYLSDFEHLTPTETELVAFASITCQGLRGPSLWHMRGMGRVLGARGTDEETQQMRDVKNMLRGIKMALIQIVDWVGGDYARLAGVENWVNVGDVGRELGGWGDD